MGTKNTRSCLFEIITIISLTACNTLFPNSTPSPTATLPLPTDTPTPTHTPAPKTVVKEQCFDIPSTPSFETTLPGILILSSPEGLSLLNFKEQTQREISGLILDVGTSPNRNWFSYSYSAHSKTPNREYLIVESADGQTRQEIPGNYKLPISNDILWLDDHRLWFPVSEIDKDPTTLVLDPFTGEQQVLLPEFPNFVPYDPGPKRPDKLYFGYSNAVYDSSLKLAIYPQFTDEDYSIVLWDRAVQKALAKIPDGGLYNHLPLWLPDETQFVLVAKRDWDQPREWLMVSREGEIRQLTHFGDLYPDFEIGRYNSLSPDGRYLAFGFSQTQDSNSMYVIKELFILDLRTLEVINTCVLFDFPAPVWSPDSQYVAVLNRDSRDTPLGIVVLDMKRQRATKISAGPKAMLKGWLNAP